MNLFSLPGETAVVGVRPENLRLAETGLAARVVHAEYLGADTILSCDVAGQSVLARLPGRVQLGAGTQVGLDFDRADLHRFDQATGLRL
jgi:ABC-type sugar transport system ATPase subunit